MVFRVLRVWGLGFRGISSFASLASGVRGLYGCKGSGLGFRAVPGFRVSGLYRGLDASA